jgi:hypothetical protein
VVGPGRDPSSIAGGAQLAPSPGSKIAAAGLPWTAFFHPSHGAAWGDAVGIALANNLGPLVGQTTNFLEDAAQGTAIYSASLASQPNPTPFQGAATASVATTASHVQVTGVAAPIDHIVM